MTPSELSALLNRQAESVCKYLLPQGKRHGQEWTVGDIAGHPGQSLKIVVEGEKIGVWSDFANPTHTGGDLLDLWMWVMKCTFIEAMTQAASFARVPLVEQGLKRSETRVYSRPERPRNARKPQGRVMAYLKARGLSEATMDDFQIGEQDDQWILFPYKRTRGGELLNTKYLHIDRIDGKKQMRQETNAEPCLFGWHALEHRYPEKRYVALCEGEIDCATLHQCGIPALSVPNGGGGGRKQDWIENDYEYLSRFDDIYLVMDNDPPGQEAEREIIRRLGVERCRVVKLPYKDPNECLLNGILHFHSFFVQAQTFDPQELKSATTFTDAVIDKFYPKPNSYQGMQSPWAHFNQAMSFQREELIVWSGFSGSGKSALLNQVVIQGLLQGERFAICSLEMPSKVTLYRMVRQLTGEKQPSDATIRTAMAWLYDKLWMIDVVGKMKTERILEVQRYAFKRYHIQNFIIDSLTKCNIREDDYEAQKLFIDEICDFNHQFEATTHLVVHQRKPMGMNGKPDKFGARGSSAITDEASSVICVYRPKELEEGEFQTRKKKNIPIIEQPDTLLFIEKNRETGIEGKFSLWFDEESLQFRENKEEPIVNYLQHIETKDAIF